MVIDVDALANEIRRVDVSHYLGAGALAEALMPFIEREVAQTADERDAERLEWVSHAWGGQRHDYANHVLSRGGDGDLSDIRTFIDKHLPGRCRTLMQPAEEGDKA